MIAKINNKDVSFALTVGRKMMGKANGQDLGDLENGPFVHMFLDPEVLGVAVWANYQDRLKEAEIETDSQLFKLIDGETRRGIEAAVKEAIIDFFPWGQKLVAQIEDQINRLGETIDRSKISGLSSGNTPESLG